MQGQGAVVDLSAVPAHSSLAETNTKVRRKTSFTDLDVHQSKPDSPQKIALRAEVAGKEEAMDLLKQQLQGV